MNIDKYIDLAEKMVISAENYIQANYNFESYKSNMTIEEFETMINAVEGNEYKKIQQLEERLCEALEKIKSY